MIITYSTISSKNYIVKRKVEIFLFFLGIREICHVRASAARVSQGVEARVLQQPLAREPFDGWQSDPLKSDPVIADAPCAKHRIFNPFRPKKPETGKDRFPVDEKDAGEGL